MSKSFNPASFTGLALLATCGLLFSLLGYFLPKDSFFNTFCATLGGTGLGSAIGIIFARIFEPSQVNHLLEVLTQANRSSILATSEDHYRDLRKCLHGYLRSRDEAGSPVWRYRIFDFSTSRTPGHLHAVVDVIRPAGGSRQFIYDGYVCGDHLVLVGQPAIARSEQHVVHVFPDAMKNQRSAMSGLCFVDSFDNSRLVTPTILSDTPLTSQTAAGQVPQAEEEALSQRWKRQLGQTRELNFDPASFAAMETER